MQKIRTQISKRGEEKNTSRGTLLDKPRSNANRSKTKRKPKWKKTKVKSKPKHKREKT
jgi:hypothetical protein